MEIVLVIIAACRNHPCSPDKPQIYYLIPVLFPFFSSTIIMGKIPTLYYTIRILRIFLTHLCQR